MALAEKRTSMRCPNERLCACFYARLSGAFRKKGRADEERAKEMNCETSRLSDLSIPLLRSLLARNKKAMKDRAAREAEQNDGDSAWL